MRDATGEFPYASEDDMKQVMRSAYTHLIHENKAHFIEGDYSGETSTPGIENLLAMNGMMSGYLFEDETAMGWAAYRSFKWVPDEFYIIMISGDIDVGMSHKYDDLDLILYNGGYIKQTIMHRSWITNDTSVFMKIGGVRIGGHDHDDAGSFQIYYGEDALAVDSGVYDSWNSNQHKCYHRRTIAHNSVVFYNGNDVTQQTTDDNGGGLGSADALLEACANPNVTGFGHEEAYGSPNGGNPLYAYLAGDIAGTYEGSTVTRMDRRMLAIYNTEDDEVPLYFFVFDATTTTNSSTPAFLLHVPKSASGYSASGKNITIVNGGGKLLLQNVYCGNGTGTPAVPRFFGNDKYKVGNNNYPTTSTKDSSLGRYEIRPTSSAASNYMLNVMMVTPTGSSVTFDNHKATYFTNSGNTVIGAQIGNSAAVFVKSGTRRSQSFNFTAPGNASTDRYNYYVSGVAAGNWRVTDSTGGSGFTVHASEESGFLAFNAHAGTVQLTYLGGN